MTGRHGCAPVALTSRLKSVCGAASAGREQVEQARGLAAAETGEDGGRQVRQVDYECLASYNATFLRLEIRRFLFVRQTEGNVILAYPSELGTISRHAWRKIGHRLQDQRSSGTLGPPAGRLTPRKGLPRKRIPGSSRDLFGRAMGNHRHQWPMPPHWAPSARHTIRPLAVLALGRQRQCQQVNMAVRAGRVRISGCGHLHRSGLSQVSRRCRSLIGRQARGLLFRTRIYINISLELRRFLR